MQWRVILESRLIETIELTPGRLAITKQVTSYFDQQQDGAYNSCGAQNVPHSNLALIISFVSPSGPSRTWIT